ncbi:class I SAM-dependent methyltransferase [Chloroflexota bacterium]
MTTHSASQEQNSIWADEDKARTMRLRVKTFYNTDYFDRIILPLLNVPQARRVLDVGCGYGGLSLLLARARPDLHITGVDVETGALESAAKSAAQDNLVNVNFEPSDAHQLKFKDSQFEAVVCQTLLTHVRDAEEVMREMARVLMPGGVFMAAEYTLSGAWSAYDNVSDSKRDEAWHQECFRVRRLYNQGKLALGSGDQRLGVRVPLLATAVGLNVFDFRLNDRALHVIPPYDHPKQEDYLELLRVMYASGLDRKRLAHNIETLRAAGGAEEDAHWLNSAVDTSALRKAIEEGTLTMLSADRLYLTFARKPNPQE